MTWSSILLLDETEAFLLDLDLFFLEYLVPKTKKINIIQKLKYTIKHKFNYLLKVTHN
jgi:hypothetical protein